MSDRLRQQQKSGVGEARDQAADSNLVGGKFSPQQIQRLRIIRAARRYNRDEHPDLSAKFQAATGISPLEIGAVRAWQRAHGLKADGKIGPATVGAALQDSNTDAEANGLGSPEKGQPEADGPANGGTGQGGREGGRALEATAKAPPSQPNRQQDASAGDNNEK